MNRKTFVYFIGNRKRRVVKVGVSHSPKARLRTMQTGNPYPLELFASLPFESMDDAMEAEAQIHWWLRYQKMHGEWFKLASTAENFVACAVAEPTMPGLLNAFR